MIETRRVAVPLAIFAAALVSSCGLQRIRTPERPGQTLVVLLPEEDGKVGRASVSNPSGTADLGAARDSTTASVNQPPAPVTVLSEAEVQRLFGAALAALPPPPQRFTLFFRFDSDEPFLVDPAKLHSRCKNTPFDEARMEGKVKLTMVAGEIVFEAA